ncbi:protein-arginine deiminase type-4 isoform X2 [Sciurus carolinensis]|uniref:protein-arginine deiminase type-4 isoform X2 n=1 Tax=Sciurus carolinensis TaxID=30640 RepID=UPI001FB30705|nr:protein-arginine deiminase type-4 isoform X2 [Sciurus carolinensis]
MAQGTVIHVAPEQPTHAVCVLGTATQLDVCGSAPGDCTSFSISASPGVQVEVAHGPPAKKNRTGSSKWPLDPELEVTLRVKAASASTGDQKVRISYYGPKTSPAQALLYLTGVEISLHADITRTGRAKLTRAMKNQVPPNQRTWTWGPSGQGAILLVNCDRDGPGSWGMDCEDDRVLDSKDLQDMSLMTLSTKTPKNFSSKHQLVLHVAKSEMDKVRVFQATGGKLPSRFKVVLGPEQPSHLLELPGGQHSRDFYVEGLTFPDSDFPGLISLGVSLLDMSNPELPEALVFQDSVVFRVAPWIMTPNTQPPQEVYVSRISDNEDFLKAVAALAKKAKCKLTICPTEENMNDQWMQDEMEIGYIQAPQQTLPVVFDSPRDRGLKDFPIKRVMGPNFGYVTRGPQIEEITGLDSFGNLEVSPPVTVGEKEYPLGRILIGNSGYPRESREVHRTLQDFLGAQQVQAPVSLYSDWLFVGHIDEFLSFVPTPDRKGFRLLLASPRSCFRLFQEKQKAGHGEVLLFQGVKRKKQWKINDILSNKILREQNSYVESCIDWNRKVLKRELGLAEGDIVDVPQLFKLARNSSGVPKAEAFFPNMVNMLVLGRHLGIPKPFGPVIDGRCCLEERVCALLEPLGLRCTFIDDFHSYHVRHGEVHCGTNVRRKPFSFKWWHMAP